MEINKSLTPMVHCNNTVERTLIFDVETTGLPQKLSGLANQPYIIQLSFIVINTTKINKNISDYQILHEYNCYIRIEDHIEISKKVVELTGITKEKCITDGVPITEVLYEFYKEYIKADCIVSHNIEFDSKMILIEMERNYVNMMKIGCQTPYAIFNPLFNRVNGIRIYCTMLQGRDITNIIGIFKDNNKTTTQQVRTYKKNPKLIELYTYLYPDRDHPIGLHDSLVDTRVCMECYIKMLTN
jgi:DNA polymerase III epsilon subunit-like protein